LTKVLTFFKGMLVGIANIIPGVSGGTFALILGIYERLLASIGGFGLRSVKVTIDFLMHPSRKNRRQEFLVSMREADAAWLLILLCGAALAVLASSRLITFLLDEYRAQTLAFFVGLIVPSIMVPVGLLGRKSWKEVLSCLVAAGMLVGLTLVFEPGQETASGLLTLFIAGAIAISAMILPGVSGSFVLMVMGEYRTVLEAINTWDFLKLGVFGAGCVVGILAFVRLLNHLLKRFHSVTIAFLIGLILGSLWVLWPFKVVASGEKIITGKNVFPVAFDAVVAWSIAAFVLGLVCSAGLFYMGKAREKTSSGV